MESPEPTIFPSPRTDHKWYNNDGRILWPQGNYRRGTERKGAGGKGFEIFSSGRNAAIVILSSQLQMTALGLHKTEFTRDQIFFVCGFVSEIMKNAFCGNVSLGNPLSHSNTQLAPRNLASGSYAYKSYFPYPPLCL